MEEFQERFTEYIKMEDQRSSRRKQTLETATNEARKEVRRPRERDQPQGSVRRHLPVSLGHRCDHYANLNASRERILEKALQVNLIFERRRETPMDADNT